MKDSEILEYLDRLNNGIYFDTIFIRQLSNDVDLGKVWPKFPMATDDVVDDYKPYTIFFIKSKNGEYVGAVLNMMSDLHWYMLPCFRKKGYLSKALKTTIIPYIFYEDGKDEQMISIDINKIGKQNYSNSIRVAELLGFKSIETEKQKDVFILLKVDFDWSNEKLNEIKSKIRRERIDILRKRIHYAAKLLLITYNELEMSCDDYEDLKGVALKANLYSDIINDFKKENLL
jgi:hypothetical protein